MQKTPPINFDPTRQANMNQHEDNPTVQAMIPQFIAHYERIWWSCGSELPAFNQTRTISQQLENERCLDEALKSMSNAISTAPQTLAEKKALQQNLMGILSALAMKLFSLQSSHMDFIQNKGFLSAIQEFAQKARQFDAQISDEDIYQAGRNVSTANLIQVLLGLPIAVTPSIFAYSMLYPYTDNYLDDPTVSTSAKIAFNQRFRQRINGEAVSPANAAEERIFTLIGMVESEWQRDAYPQVYESLLAIHRAQAHSLDLVKANGAPFDDDILGISFEKGGTSVLADGYLVAGQLTVDQARILFGFGSFTQLMDDLEDLKMDLKEQRASLFSMTASHWKVDALACRYFHYGRKVTHDLTAFNTADAAMIAELMTAFLDPMLLDGAGKSAEFFSKRCLKTLEQHMPIRFAALKKRRQKLGQQKELISQLLNVFLTTDEVA